MDDSMFDKLSAHQRRVIDHVQSKQSGVENNVSNNGAAVTSLSLQKDQQYFQEPTTAASGATVMMQQHQHYDLPAVLAPIYENGGVGADGYGSVNMDHPLHIEQAMQFLSHDGHENEMIMNEPLSTIDVDPIPYYSQNQPQYMPQEQHQSQPMMPSVVSKHIPAPHGSTYQPPPAPPRYSLLSHTGNPATTMNTTNNNNNNHRGSVSALSIDWEVYELFNEFVSSDGPEHENEGHLMMGGPVDDYHGSCNPMLQQPPTNYHVSSLHPIQEQQQSQKLEQTYQLESHDDIFQV